MQAIHVADPSAGVRGLELTTQPIPFISSPLDVLVKLNAVALNPVDTKTRDGLVGDSKGKILGYDGAGVVIEVGSHVKTFSKGDAVLYAGDVNRPGSNAQYQVVDSRIVGKKPDGLAWDEAAALPLVGLTAWEMFEDKFGLKPGDNSKEILLIVNGAGGVGSMAIQLAKKVFGIEQVIATASRSETVDWVKKMGATGVLNHREDLGPQLEKLSIQPTLVFITYDTPRYVKELAPHVRACAKFGSIVEDDKPIPINDVGVFTKGLSFSWEFMFAKTMYKYAEDTQGAILKKLAQFAADGTIRSMITKHDTLSVAALRAGHELQESGKSIGKIAFVVPDTLS